jgi:hypothetical protein
MVERRAMDERVSVSIERKPTSEDDAMRCDAMRISKPRPIGDRSDRPLGAPTRMSRLHSRRNATQPRLGGEPTLAPPAGRLRHTIWTPFNAGALSRTRHQLINQIIMFGAGRPAGEARWKWSASNLGAPCGAH